MIFSKMIRGLVRKGALGGFNQNQIRDIMQGISYEKSIILVGTGMGGGVMRARFISGFLLGGPGYMHGSEKCSC